MIATDSRPKQSWKNYPVVKALYLARGSPQWKGMSFMWRDVTSILLCIEWGFSLWSLPKSFNSRKIIITILLSASFIYLHDPSWNPLSTSRNGQDIYNHITSYVIFIVCIKIEIVRLCCTQFHPMRRCESLKTPSHRQADEVYYEDEGETGQKQSADMYWNRLRVAGKHVLDKKESLLFTLSPTIVQVENYLNWRDPFSTSWLWNEEYSLRWRFISINMLKSELMLRGNVFLMWRFKLIYQQPIPLQRISNKDKFIL